MTIAGNQYADKIFSEHPIALWPLDEEVYFLSLIDDNARYLSNWSYNGPSVTFNDSPDIPAASTIIDSDIYSSFTPDSELAVTVDVESQELFSASNIDILSGTFTVNFFLYQNPTNINWIKVGYRYLDASPTPQEIEVISDEIIPPPLESWLNFNRTYVIPDSWSGPVRLFIQVSYSESDVAEIPSKEIIVQGLSVGQDSQTSCYNSLGSTQSSIPTSANLPTMTGIEADRYGILEDYGYYLVRNNRLLAKNDGVPIIYGTNQSTKIYPSNADLPSLIFPGKGMLNESGRNKQYTLESWIKIDASTSYAQRIMGPLSTDDGLYVKGGFLTLSIGSESSSYCVGEWYRPILVHIVLKEENAIVLVNGETVINIPFNRKTVSLPNDVDWWGVYSYSTFSSFNIDSISIYPYILPESVAKRRFVYGQGTPSIESIDNGLKGTPTVIDFSTSQYGPSVIYPDIYRWDAGSFNNLNASKNFLSVPNYSLPIINIGGRDLQGWYQDNYELNTIEYPARNHPNFISFRPNIDYSTEDPSWNYAGQNYTEQSYLNFPSLNILNDTVSSVYGIFEVEEYILEKRILMSFSNTSTGDTFDIVVEGNPDDITESTNIISYLYNGVAIVDANGEECRLTVELGSEKAVGLNFELAGISYGYSVSRFFSSPSSVQLYIAGNGYTTFEGKIYAIGFSNQENYALIEDSFDSNGIINPNYYEILLNHIASYTLVPEYEYGNLFLDISVASSWEEYYPLSFFAGYVKDENGDSVYDIDYLQLNVAYQYVETEGTWTYLELFNQYSGQTYSDLQSSIYSNYFNLYKNNSTGQTINISNSSLQSYITFQKLSSGANAPISDFANTKQLSTIGVIYADDENTIDEPEKAYNTKFAFIDNTIVYPPKSLDFNDYAMVVHFDIKQRSILKNPLKIRKFEISSNNLNYNSLLDDENQKNYIGTKFGSKIYPKTISSGTSDYKNANPLAIYKTGTPYLYLTKKSGIELLNGTDFSSPEQEYMAAIPVNKNGSSDFFVSAMQLFMLGKLSELPQQQKMFEVLYKDGKIIFVVEKEDSGNYLKAYFDDGVSTTIMTGVSFYQNGRFVYYPKITNYEWNAIGITFSEEIDFSNSSIGEIRMFGGAVFNNVSFYLSKGLGKITNINARTWNLVLDQDQDSINEDWNYWYTNTDSWKQVLVLGETSTSFLTASNIYDIYCGTNKSVIDDNKGIRLKKTKTSIFTDVSWSSITEKPV